MCVVVCSSPVIKTNYWTVHWQGIFLSILLCNHTGNHPRGELARFGYRSERKVKIVKNPVIIWQPAARTYCLDMVILFQKILPNLPTWTHFFHKKCFLWVPVQFLFLFYFIFLHGMAKIYPKRNAFRTTLWIMGVTNVW